MKVLIGSKMKLFRQILSYLLGKGSDDFLQTYDDSSCHQREHMRMA